MNSNLDAQNDMHRLAHIAPDESAPYVPTPAERAEAAAPAPAPRPYVRPAGQSFRRVIRGVYDRKGHYHDID